MSTFSTRVTATGTAFTGRCRIRGVAFLSGATSGSIVFKDGGASGKTTCSLDTPGITTSGTTGSGFIPIPGDGIMHATDVYVTVTTTAAVTIFYETYG